MKIVKRITICLILAGLLAGCHCKNIDKENQVVESKIDKEQMITILAIVRFLRANRNGNNWGQKEYKAEFEYQRYLMEQK